MVEVDQLFGHFYAAESYFFIREYNII